MPSSPAIFVCEYRSFRICLTTSGGKAGKGCNKTASLRVSGPLGFRYVPFRVDEPGARQVACQRARAWCDRRILAESTAKATA